MQIKANPQIINNNYKIENKREDFSELSIIKILIEMPNLIDSILDFVDSNMFYTHKEEFNLVLKNNLEHEKLIKIVLREEIKLINEDELKDNLILMQKKYYQNIIKNTLLNDLDFKKQIKIKKKINQAINRLKEYKLVKYENFFD
jgi:DNA primase